MSFEATCSIVHSWLKENHLLKTARTFEEEHGKIKPIIGVSLDKIINIYQLFQEIFNSYEVSKPDTCVKPNSKSKKKKEESEKDPIELLAEAEAKKQKNLILQEQKLLRSNTFYCPELESRLTSLCRELGHDVIDENDHITDNFKMFNQHLHDSLSTIPQSNKNSSIQPKSNIKVDLPEPKVISKESRECDIKITNQISIDKVEEPTKEKKKKKSKKDDSNVATTNHKDNDINNNIDIDYEEERESKKKKKKKKHSEDINDIELPLQEITPKKKKKRKTVEEEEPVYEVEEESSHKEKKKKKKKKRHSDE